MHFVYLSMESAALSKGKKYFNINAWVVLNAAKSRSYVSEAISTATR